VVDPGEACWQRTALTTLSQPNPVSGHLGVYTPVLAGYAKYIEIESPGGMG
jgi:hypothetical protein